MYRLRLITDQTGGLLIHIHQLVQLLTVTADTQAYLQRQWRNNSSASACSQRPVPILGQHAEEVNLKDNALSEDRPTLDFFVNLAQQSKSSWKTSKEELYYAAQWVAKKGFVGVLRACHDSTS
jgi:hypothetical protein